MSAHLQGQRAGKLMAGLCLRITHNCPLRLSMTQLLCTPDQRKMLPSYVIRASCMGPASRCSGPQRSDMKSSAWSTTLFFFTSFRSGACTTNWSPRTGHVMSEQLRSTSALGCSSMHRHATAQTLCRQVWCHHAARLPRLQCRCTAAGRRFRPFSSASAPGRPSARCGAGLLLGHCRRPHLGAWLASPALAHGFR